MLNTIALFSSSRRSGNTGQFMDRIASELAIEVVDLAKLRLSPYDYDHRNRDDDFEPLMERKRVGVAPCGASILTCGA